MTQVLATSTASNARGTAHGFFLIILAIAAYLLPTIIAIVRHKHIPNYGDLIVLNFFLGWTFVGWVIALVMAVRSKPYGQAPPYGGIQVPPKAPPQPWVPPTAQWHDPGGMAGP
jgi:hypothetical protein